MHFDEHHILVLDLEATSTEALTALETAEIQVCSVRRRRGSCVVEGRVCVCVCVGLGAFVSVFPRRGREWEERAASLCLRPVSSCLWAPKGLRGGGGKPSYPLLLLTSSPPQHPPPTHTPRHDDKAATVAAIAELQGADPDREAVLVNVYQVTHDR